MRKRIAGCAAARIGRTALLCAAHASPSLHRPILIFSKNLPVRPREQSWRLIWKSDNPNSHRIAVAILPRSVVTSQHLNARRLSSLGRSFILDQFLRTRPGQMVVGGGSPRLCRPATLLQVIALFPVRGDLSHRRQVSLRIAAVEDDVLRVTQSRSTRSFARAPKMCSQSDACTHSAIGSRGLLYVCRFSSTPIGIRNSSRVGGR